MLALAGMVILGVSGAITALGDTLFPAGSLAEGFRQDLHPTTHVFLRLRLWHPLIALAVGIGVWWVSWNVRRVQPQPVVMKLSVTLSALVAIQLSAGATNLLLLAPIWMQLIHLLLSDLMWIVLVLLAVTVIVIPQDSADRKKVTKTADQGEQRRRATTLPWSPRD
jgi:heme A synthase